MLQAVLRIGKQVYFSPGNLRCTNALNSADSWSYITSYPQFFTWSFADNQYDYLGSANISNGAIAPKVIDLFRISTSNTNYAWGIGGATSTATEYNTTSSTTNFKDWGQNTIGDYAANTWRTPTSAEWTYLLNRTGKVGLATITVNGTAIPGCVLLPDSWTQPSGVSFSASTTAYTANSYTLAQWEKMENAGAVFLPAGRAVYANYVTNYVVTLWDRTQGWYWSSTAQSASMYYNLAFEAAQAKVTTAGIIYGMSVRLVRDK